MGLPAGKPTGSAVLTEINTHPYSRKRAASPFAASAASHRYLSLPLYSLQQKKDTKKRSLLQESVFYRL